MAANVQFSILLMFVMGIILFMLVDKRFKQRIISAKTRNVQFVEIAVLVVSITLTDILQFVVPLFANKFVLNGTEIALIVLFLIVDKLINKNESFLG